MDNFSDLVPPVLHSHDEGYLYTPIGFSWDKNALTTTTHSKNIPSRYGLARHSELRQPGESRPA
jgi:hypothetical protein